MATGTLPFQGDSPELVLQSILTHQPLRLRKLNPALSAELERIALRALEKDRTARYQSAAELRIDLERLQPALSRNAWWPVVLAATLMLALGLTLAGLRFGWFGTLSTT